jgi:hypothetical protein
VEDCYAETTLVVDGALEEELIFTDDDQLGAYIIRIAAEADPNQVTEIYLIIHPHPLAPDQECSCIQYEQDHKPVFRFPAEV